VTVQVSAGRHGPFPGVLDRERIAAYAGATGDPTRAVQAGEVSGDWSAHHFDIDVARSAGFDFLFAHGLCTMAMCTHRMLDVIGVGDPARVRRVAVGVRVADPPWR
jgi:acyl dehydratase